MKGRILVVLLACGLAAILWSCLGSSPSASSASQPGFVQLSQQRSMLRTSPRLPEYEEWLKDIEHFHPNDVFLTICDRKYAGRFNELLQVSSKQFPHALLAVVALDQATFDWFTYRGVPCILLKDGSIKERIIQAKFKATLALLRKGWTVYFSDMDVFWRSSPALDHSKEFLVSHHKFHPELNIGFFVAHPTPGVLAAFTRLAKYVDLPGHHPSPDCKDLDQRLMEVAIHGPVEDNVIVDKNNGLPECTSFTTSELQRLVPPEPLDYDYIPNNILEHSEVSNLSSPELAGIHVRSAIGPPEAQIKYAMQNFVTTQIKFNDM